ncbi:hypothetical protein [Paraburkholderia sp. C35]|uniref:hypothetical protein n=1 Tax=Paraburkholderia sp. C35 TaxID=2126993 RepID=UPI000D695D1A|nr:hypothetical protein [Paraburkholderia sp. C35]
MTNMSDVSEVIDAASHADTNELVTTALARVTEPAELKITQHLDVPATAAGGEIIEAIKPLQFPVRDVHIAALHSFLDGIQFAVATPDGMKEAKGAYSNLTKLKKLVEETYTTWNTPIRDLQEDARNKRDYVIAEVDAMRAPIKEQIDAQTAIETAERNKKAKEESQRIEAHVAAVKVLTDMPTQYLSASSETIEQVIAEISSIDSLSRRDWQEYLPAATDAIRTNIATLNQHLENAKAREEVARMRAAQDEADRENERKAALRERIHNIELAPTTVADATSEAIQKKLNRLEQTDPSTFEEMAAEATAAIENTRNVLQTMLDAALKNESAARQAAEDAAELAALRAEKAQREQAAATAAENAAREQREATERKEREDREEAERIEREKQEAARVARERAEAVAETLLALLIEARAHVPAGDLADRIDTAVASAQGE